jgi:hypothetical protein
MYHHNQHYNVCYFNRAEKNRRIAKADLRVRGHKEMDLLQNRVEL